MQTICLDRTRRGTRHTADEHEPHDQHAKGWDPQGEVDRSVAGRGDDRQSREQRVSDRRSNSAAACADSDKYSGGQDDPEIDIIIDII